MIKVCYELNVGGAIRYIEFLCVYRILFDEKY